MRAAIDRARALSKQLPEQDRLEIEASNAYFYKRNDEARSIAREILQRNLGDGARRARHDHRDRPGPREVLARARELVEWQVGDRSGTRSGMGARVAHVP